MTIPRAAQAIDLIKTLKEQILMSDHELSRMGKDDHEKQCLILIQRLEDLLGRELTEIEQEGVGL